tara:strand:+ start:2759 stop:4957 length:2199 start_codon:yes stop_codon:yes gene_type:complete
MVSFRGLMRGAAEAGTRKLQSVNYLDEQGIEQIAQTFQKTAPKIQEAQEKAATQNKEIENLSRMYTIPKDVVYEILNIYGGNNQQAKNHLDKLYTAYIKKGNTIPTMKLSEQTDTMLKKPEEMTPPVAKEEEKSPLETLGSLFKTRDRDALINEFINRNPGLDETTVRNVLSGNYDVPSFTPTTRMTSEAFMAGRIADEKTGTFADILKNTKYYNLPSQVGDLIKNATTSPANYSKTQQTLIRGLSSQLAEAMEKYQNKETRNESIVELDAIVATLEDTFPAKDKDTKDSFKNSAYSYLPDALKTLDEKLKYDDKTKFSSTDKALIQDLRPELSDAMTLYSTNPKEAINKLRAIEQTIVRISPELVPSQSESALVEKTKAIVNEMAKNFIKAYPDKTFPYESVFGTIKSKLAAGKTAVDGFEGTPQFVYDPDTKTVKQALALNNTIMMTDNKGKTVVTVRPKIREKNRKQISKIDNLYGTLSQNMYDLKKYPNAFNFVGRLMVQAGDAQDIFNSVANSNVDLIDIKGTTRQAEMQRGVIPLLSIAKDSLFDDPRLSDQDLKIVLDYSAVIRGNLGSNRAFAAMFGLQTAFLKDKAIRLIENNLNMPIRTANLSGDGSKLGMFNEDGSVKDAESSISMKLLHDGMKQYRYSDGSFMKLLSKEEVRKELASNNNKKTLKLQEYERAYNILEAQIYEAVTPLIMDDYQSVVRGGESSIQKWRANSKSSFANPNIN